MIVPKVIYRDKLQPHSWARWFNAQVHKKNSNNLVSVVGRTGSGKTWSAITICEIMSKMDGVPFGIENIVFSLRELMELINSGKLQRGSKIIFDEPQVSISAREFQSEANKVFNYLLSTFRHRNFSLFFCTPFETLLDKNTRKLFHVKIETAGVDSKNNTCKLIPLYLEHVDFQEEPYKKKLIVVFPNEDKTKTLSIRLDDWVIPRASNELIKLYEEKKMAFTTNLNKNIQARLSKYEDSGKSMTAPQEEEKYIPIKQKVSEALIEDYKMYPNDLDKNRAERLGTIPENICSAKKSKKFQQFLKRNMEMRIIINKRQGESYLESSA